MIGALSVIKWHVVVAPSTQAANTSAVLVGGDSSALNTSIPQPPSTSASDFKNLSGTSPFRPNGMALQLMLIFQLLFPLVLYALCLYICIRKTFKIPRALIIAVIFTASWSLLACGLMYAYDFSFW
jgi:hypothetical protein